MGIFKRTEKRSSTSSQYTLTDDQAFLQMLGIDATSLDVNKLGEITYFTCMKILAESIAKLPLKLYKETDSGIEEAKDHYLYNLMKLRPNQYMSAWNFWACVEINKNHFGNTFVYLDTEIIGKKAGQIKGLYLLPSDRVQIWIDNEGIISKDNALWYVYTDNAGKEYKIMNTQILHFKTSTTFDGIRGLSVQQVLRMNIENAQSGSNFINNYWKNGMMIKGLLQYTGDINDGSMKKMQAKFENMANGIQNAGRILPVPFGFNFTTLGNTSMADNQFLEINRYTALQIGASMGIKPNQLNQSTKDNKGNVENEQRSFYIDTLLSVLTMYEQEMTYKLLLPSEVAKNYHFKFDIDIITRASFESRIQAYASGINNSIFTPNECRAKEGLPFKTEGNVLIANGNYIPLSKVGDQYSESQPQEGGEQE